MHYLSEWSLILCGWSFKQDYLVWAIALNISLHLWLSGQSSYYCLLRVIVVLSDLTQLSWFAVLSEFILRSYPKKTCLILSEWSCSTYSEWWCLMFKNDHWAFSLVINMLGSLAAVFIFVFPLCSIWGTAQMVRKFNKHEESTFQIPGYSWICFVIYRIKNSFPIVCDVS